MSEIDKRIDSLVHWILYEPAYTPAQMKNKIKQLMADEFEKAKIEQTELIRDRFVRGGWEYKWLTEIIDELRQKLEELKK